MNKVIFWDWSGTLADESLLDKAVCMTIEEKLAQKEKISFEKAEERFNNYLKILENTWQWHDYVLHGQNLGIDWKICQEKNLNKLTLVPDARDMLEYCRNLGYKNILATNAVRDVILLRAGHAGMLGLFDRIIASDDAQALKSSGKHYKIGLEVYNGSIKDSFSIGDNPVQDIRPAAEIGLNTIFCVYGKNRTHYHSCHLRPNHDETAEADFNIHTLKEIEDII